MTRVYSAVLVELHHGPSGGLFLTIPAGERWVIKQIATFTTGAAGEGFMQIVRIDNDVTIAFDQYTTEVTSEWHHQDQLHLVLEESVEYAFFCGSVSDLVLHGYKLTLP